MKYLSKTTVLNAYKANKSITQNKFWGLLAILSSIDTVVKSGVSYSFKTNCVSKKLEEIFNLSENKKEYISSADWYIMLSKSWVEKVQEQMINGDAKPNAYNAAIWFLRNSEFSDTATKEDILRLFVKSIHLSQDDFENLFEIKDINIEFADVKYSDEVLCSEIKTALNITSLYTNVTAEGAFVAANAGELSRAPFVQTMYASQKISECLILTQFDFTKEYSCNKYLDDISTGDKLESNQIIYYGCPGSGKSHMVNEITKQKECSRTFEDFLSSKGLSESSCGKYAKVLTTQWVIDIVKNMGANITSLNDVDDTTLVGKILGNPTFIQNNNTGNNMYSVALKHYIDFLNTKEKQYIFRTTFHPDTDYASFVGCYKPMAEGHNGNYRFKSLQDLKAEANIINSSSGDKVSQIVAFVTKYANDLQYIVDTDPNIKSLQNLLNKNLSFANETYLAYVVDYVLKNQETRITYKFCPQVFTNAYIKAWEDTSKPVYLIIEEINRGNCAQIFGDLFQLLDRDKETGKSEYPIKADKDLVAHIEKVLGAGHEGIKNGELCLPPNLIIYATMNTSDQSLFPMDSAFKRRWDWEYVPINYSKDIDSGKFIIEIDDTTKYSWVEFLESVNDKIYDATNSEDKQMGNFFIKKSIKANEFVNKVMFYLWNEVCKEEYGTQRNFFRKGKEGKTEFKFTELFGDNQATILKEFMTSLGVEPIGKKPEEPAAE